MHRRGLLASLVGLAGCAGLPGSEGSGSSGRTVNPMLEDTPTGNVTRSATGSRDDPGSASVDVLTFEAAERTYALPMGYRVSGRTGRDLDVRVRFEFLAPATAEHPARVGAELVNRQDTAVSLLLARLPGFGDVMSESPSPLFGFHSGPSAEGALVFAPGPEHDLVDSPPRVEKDETGRWRVDVRSARGALPRRIDLDPGDPVRGQYLLAGRSTDTGNGHPTGLYAFSRSDDDPDFEVAVWDAEQPGPVAYSRFHGRRVPSLPRERSAVWFHEAGPSTALYARPLREQFGLPGRIRVAVVNHTKRRVGCRGWVLYKLADGDWYRIWPLSRAAVCRTLRPGRIDPLNLAVSSGSVPFEEATSTDAGIGWLGGGDYAVVSTVEAEAGLPAALLRMVGPDATVIPTEDLDTERQGSTVRAVSREFTGGQNDGLLTVRRVDQTGAERLIVEQIMNYPGSGFRNSLSLFDPGLDEVRLRTAQSAVAVSLPRNEQRRFRFQGSEYVARFDSGG